jgi:hypothetical protein
VGYFVSNASPISLQQTNAVAFAEFLLQYYTQQTGDAEINVALQVKW